MRTAEANHKIFSKLTITLNLPAKIDGERIACSPDVPGMRRLEMSRDQEGVLGTAELQQLAAAPAGHRLVPALDGAPLPEWHLDRGMYEVTGEHSGQALGSEFDADVTRRVARRWVESEAV